MLEFFQEHFILSAIWVALALWLVYSFIADFTSPVKSINTHEATMLINREDAILLDTRSVKEYREGHITGASQLKPEELTKADFKRLEKEKSKPIIVVCAMGMSAKKTAVQMHKAGFENVTVLKGGMNAWQQASLPVSKA